MADFVVQVSAYAEKVRVELLREGKAIAHDDVAAGRALATQLLLAIEGMCAKAEITLTDLSNVELQSKSEDSSAHRAAKIVTDMLTEALHTR